MRFWNLGGFFSSVKGHVVKWWQSVIMPVIRINNNNTAQNLQPPAQQPQQQPVQPPAQQPVQQTAQQPVQQTAQQPVSESLNTPVPETAIVHMQEEKKADTDAAINRTGTAKSEEQTIQGASVPTEDTMEIVRRITGEKEQARQKEIERTRRKAMEEARIAEIMNANKVDVNAFIEAGKAAKEEIAAKKQQEADMQRAREIIDRLNREAAEDEAKKQAEIDAAKQEAEKHFGEMVE